MSKADDKQLRREVILAVMVNAKNRTATVMISDSVTIIDWINSGDQKIEPKPMMG